MAVNFGDTLMEGSIEPTVQVQAPVQDDSGAIFAQAMGSAAQAVGAIAGGIFKQGQVDNNAKILTQYENDLLDLADAVDQNTISRNEAMIKARNIRRQYLSNAPGLQDDFDTIWTDFAGANGLGHVVVQGTQEQQREEALRTEAAKLGYTPEEFTLFQSRARQATELNYQIDLAEKSGKVVTETQRLQGIQALAGVAQAAYPSAQRQINEAMAAIQANPDNKGQVAEQLNNVMGNSIAQLKQLGGNADSAYIVAPIEQAMATFNKWVNGEVPNTIMEAELKGTQLKYDLMFATDSTYGPRIAVSRMLSNVGLENMGYEMWDPGSAKKLVDLIDGKGTIIDQTPESQRTLENIATSAGAVTDTTSKEEIDEIRASIEGMITSVYMNERSAEGGAMAFKDVVNNFGRPEIASFIAKHGIAPKYAQQVASIFKQSYETELLPVINRTWLGTVPILDPMVMGATGAEGGVPGISNIPMSELLEPRWNGNAVELVPTAAYANNGRVISLAQDMTSGDNSIAGPLNSLISTMSQLTGVDPQKIYEEDFAGRAFGIVEETPAERVTKMLDEAQGVESEAFVMGDFNPETLEPIEEWANQASSLETELPPLDPAFTSVEGIDYASYLPSIRAAESGGDDSATNPSSTATGRYQFLKSTWNDLVNRYPNTGLTFEGRLDPQQQEVAIRLFTAENARMLKARGVNLTNGTLYAAHFLGAGDAVKVLKAQSGLVSDFVPAKVIKANPFLRGMTVSQFKAWVNRKGNA